MTQFSSRILCLSALSFSAVLTVKAADAPKITPEQSAFFETKVRPVLADNCYKCHSEKKQAGNLRVDSLAALLKGGDFGPSLVPGDPEKSKLVEAIRYHNDDLQMPPAGKMKQPDIDAIVEWVKMGAPWPNAGGAGEAPKTVAKVWTITPQQRAFWSLQPIKKVALPVVKDKAWIKSPIDNFILARLEAAGLQPAPPADRRTLIRRAYFDLVGLAPTPEEVDAFLNDKAPDAYAKVVDKLLASPQYGERWGRRWLDVARYADSNGLDENTAFGNAWRYRDYVIAALNKDKPYNEFVKEQIAGDLMPTDDPMLRNDRLTATAFMSLGAKVLAEPDKPKFAMDIVDEQIDTTTKAVLGLTVACARCHDHKFDPISTKDYYAIAGIFKSTRTMVNLNTVAKVFQRPLASPEVEAEIKIKQEDVKKADGEVKRISNAANQDLRSALNNDVGKYILAGWELAQGGGLFTIGDTPVKAGDPERLIIEAEKYNRGDFTKNFDSYGKDIGVIHSANSTFAEWDITLPAAGDYQLELRYAAQDSRPVRLKVNDQTIAENALTGTTGSWNPDGQKWEAQGIFKFIEGKNVLRLESKGVIPHIDKLLVVASKAPEGQAAPSRTAQQIAGQRKLIQSVVEAWAKTLRPLRGKAEFAAWKELAMAPDADFNASAQKIATQVKGTEGAELAPIRAAITAKKGPLTVPDKAEELYPKDVKDKLAKANEVLKKAQEAVPQAPMTIAVEDAATIENVKVHIRGSTQSLGDEVPRRFPTVLAGETQTPLPEKTSGRLQFAEWMAKDDHPLTSRVMVNRVWQGHFGEGIVRSPDNFGLRGELPSHPELLDYLSATFVENGWSLKKMHRQIMLSNTYQMSSLSNAKGELKDPDNKLFWRMNRRRLEAEPLRDTLLQVSGQLDLSPGGTLLSTKDSDYVTNDQSKNGAQYDKPRRSIYLPVIRNAVYDFFQAFDFGDPSSVNGKRADTTIAPQALYMMNSPFVMEQARHFAESLLAQKDKSDADLLRIAYLRAYSRVPAAAETTRATAFLARYDAALIASEPDAAKRRVKVWSGLCQVLLAANEFVFVN